MFDKTDFCGWKGRMSLFLESIDNNMPDILLDDPISPKLLLSLKGQVIKRVHLMSDLLSNPEQTGVTRIGEW